MSGWDIFDILQKQVSNFSGEMAERTKIRVIRLNFGDGRGRGGTINFFREV